MKIVYNRGNGFFNSYLIFDDKGLKIGIIEHHYSRVNQKYFVGWKLDYPGAVNGKTKMFYTVEEAIFYSVGEVSILIPEELK